LSDLKNDVGSDMDDKLGHEEILKILSSMPEQASPHEVTALITNIILAYNLQSEWYMIAHMTHDTLNEIANMNGYSTIH
jgi:hypothetical protein